MKFTNLNAADLTFTRSIGDTNDVVVIVNATGDKITIDNQISGAASGVEQVQFANGMTWDSATLQVNSRNLIGTSAAETINGTTGNDTITGNGGNDTLHGNAGNDTYDYALGDGNDLIQEYGSSSDSDTLKFANLNVVDVTFARFLTDLNDLIVTVNSTGEKITVDNQFFGAASAIEQVQFADGTVWDSAAITSNAWVRGTSGNDSITLSATGVTADAGAGNDTLTVSGNGSDRIIFAKGYGHDTLNNSGSGYNRDDTLVLSDINPWEVQFSRSGNAMILSVPSTGDVFTVNYQFWGDGSQIQGLSHVQFADGTVWDRTTIATNAWVRGTSGNDSITLPATGVTVDAGAGNDTLTVSGNGADRIIFAKGYGHDTLTNPSSGYNRDDTLVLSDINPWEVQFSRSGNAMTLSIPSTGDVFTVNYQFWGDGSQIQGLSHVQFADASNWNRSNLLDATSTFTWTGSASNTTLTGNDYGSNIFQLGAGPETANGGARKNVFQATTSTGQAEINLSSATGSANELDFLGGITNQNLWFEQSGNDLAIDLLGTNTTTTINDWFSGSSSALQEITAGSLKIDSQLAQLVSAMATYSAAHSSFNPATASQMPVDSSLQNAVASAWH